MTEQEILARGLRLRLAGPVHPIDSVEDWKVLTTIRRDDLERILRYLDPKNETVGVLEELRSR